MFGNFDSIENSGFHSLSAQCIMDDSGTQIHFEHYKAFAYDVTAAILVFQNKETAAILV